jgi:hypothetical protein
MRRAITTSTLLVLSSFLVGAECEETPEDDPIRTVDRSDVEPTTEGAWASSPWVIEDPDVDGLIEIEPGTRIKLYHGLGRTPVDVHAYVGFSEDGSRIMPTSGNAAEIHEVGSDDSCAAGSCDYVIIRNGSGGSFFYRFVLR